MGRSTRRLAFDDVDQLEGASERNRVAAKDRALKLTDEQTLAATRVYDAHGGVAAHLDLMLQTLSLASPRPSDEILAQHRVTQFTIPIAEFLDIVREVYSEVVFAEHAANFANAMGFGTPSSSPTAAAAAAGRSGGGRSSSTSSPMGGMTRTQRAAQADAKIAYEALHGGRSADATQARSGGGRRGSTFDAFAEESIDDTTSASSATAASTSSAAAAARVKKVDRFADTSTELESDVLRLIVEPMLGKSYEDFCLAILPRDENPEFVRAFIRLGATRVDDLGYSLDTAKLIERCEAIGLSVDEQQALVNLFDNDCSGDIDFEEFKAIMTGDLSEYGLRDAVLSALQKLLGGRGRKASTADGNGAASGGGGASGKGGGGGNGTPRNRGMVSLSSQIGLGRGRSGSLRRRMTMLAMMGNGAAVGDEDDEDEDPTIRELRVLEGMRTTVHSCEEQQPETDAVASRVNDFARDVRVRAARERQRERDDKYPPRHGASQSQSQSSSHATGRRASERSTAASTMDPSSPTAAEHSPANDDDGQPTDEQRAADKLPPITAPKDATRNPHHQSTYGSQQKCSSKARSQQRKLVWTLEDHKRRQAARERLSGGGGGSPQRHASTTAAAAEPQSTLRHAQGLLIRRGLAAGMVPINVAAPPPSTAAHSPHGTTTTAKTARPSRLAPVPPASRKPSDGDATGDNSSAAPSPDAARTARSLPDRPLGSREGLYRQILGGGAGRGEATTQQMVGSAWRRSYDSPSASTPRAGGTAGSTRATYPSPKQRSPKKHA